ncbi:HD domain-containing protein [Salidesulfovibrio onnuriiensis]|uniref:HD domain-containing protein n=1 Tax=Salidesulfovibrio onnuriiensis TaxID=2583823 RepID=UPI0011C6EB8D|nr:HD domain-containing protein [Salidesulfovibrio onnuriiensis]
MQIYLVGGGVRDLLLGRAVRDKDYLVTNATKEQFKTTFPEAQEVGKAFPVFLIQGKEYAFPRGKNLEADLLARDLTINAMALGQQGELTCHPQAMDDLSNRVLRPTSGTALLEDPLRVFRAARFYALLPEFSPHPELLEAMEKLSDSEAIRDIASDRVGQETRKALGTPKPGNFLRLLDRADCLRPWFRELAEASAIPAGPPPHHHTNVLEHTAEIMDKVAGDPLCAWMALCHDLGKCATPKEEWPRHIGHESTGARLAEQLGTRLRLPLKYIKAGQKAALLHMKAGRYAELRPGTRVDLLMEAHLARITEPLFKLAAADQGTDHSPQARAELATILMVSLPEKDRNLGAASGERLRLLRAQSIAG